VKYTDHFKRCNCFQDGYIDRNFQIQYDRSQDCQLEKQYGNAFQFRRRFSTCDPKDFAFEAAGTTHFIIAGGYVFTRDFNSDSVIKDMKFNLLLQTDHPTMPVELEKGHFKILAGGVHVPNQVNTYWCVIRRIPKSIAQKKHHIIGVGIVELAFFERFREITMVRPYIQQGNEHVVHHMEQIFVCESEYQREYDGECDALSNSKEARSCSGVLAAWAKGEGAIYYPSEAGRPIGGRKGKKYVKVEIHYNNPRKYSGIIDDSGIEIVVTTNLRKHDAGVMEVGLIYSDANSIPPGQSAFPLTGHCTADCTNKLPEEGIYIFGSQLHAHKMGRKIVSNLYRNGVKIAEINRDNHFTHYWQHFVHLRPYVHVLPGDVLSTTCVYETLSRGAVTLGGYSLEEEMCVNYIYYYPASSVEVCKSAVDNTTLHNYFEYQLVKQEVFVAKKLNL
uniref:DOMON domain-containing protein n=1 Tax=Angiostrongylus costaricensis TaxID=334426 RepID=A0A0R3PY91_ANGCS